MGAHNGGLRTAIYTTRLHHTRARARYLSRLTTPKALWLSGGDDARTSAAHSDSHCGPARCRVGATHPVPRSAPTQERSALSAASTALRMPRMARPPSSDISYIRFTHYTELSANRIGIHTPRVSRAREPRCTLPCASRVARARTVHLCACTMFRRPPPRSPAVRGMDAHASHFATFFRLRLRTHCWRPFAYLILRPKNLKHARQVAPV